MAVLGQMAWWRVSNVELPYTLAEKIMAELGFAIPAPNPVLPVDAFRRLTGEASATYRVDDVDVTLDLHTVANPSAQILVRDIVRTAKRDKVVQSIEKVGDCAFYKPPKGQPSKARLRINVHSREPQVMEFADGLRTEYTSALNVLDSQAVRRIIRAHLSSVFALPLSGPYFFRSEEDVAPLARLFEHLGDDSVLHQMPVEDSELSRHMVTAALEHAPPATVDAWCSLTGLAQEVT